LLLPKYGTVYLPYSCLCRSWFWTITVATLVNYGVALLCAVACVGALSIT